MQALLFRQELPADIASACAESVSRTLNHMNADDLATEQGKRIARSWLQLLNHTDDQTRSVLVRSVRTLASDDSLCIRRSLGPVIFRGDLKISRRMPSDQAPDLLLLSHMETFCESESSTICRSCLQAYGQLARHSQISKVLLAGVLKRLLIQLASFEEQPMLRVAAYEQIQDIAYFRHSSRSPEAVNSLIQSVRDELYQGILIEWFTAHGSQKAIRTMISEITQLLDRKYSDFQEELITIALPKLVRYRAAVVLQKLADFTGEQLSMMVFRTEHFMKVLGEGLLYSPPGQHLDFLKYVRESVLDKTVCHADIVQIMKDNQPDLIDIAVWELGMVDPVGSSASFARGRDCLKFVANCMEPALRYDIACAFVFQIYLKFTCAV